MHKLIRGCSYPASILLVCAFVVAMLVTFAKSESAFATPHFTSSAQSISCGNDIRSIPRVSGHTLYYGSVVTCTGGNAARIAVTFSVQILSGSQWIVNATQSNSCPDCAFLRSPKGVGSYSYTGAPSQKVRVVVVFGVKDKNGSSEGESGIIGPFTFAS